MAKYLVLYGPTHKTGQELRYRLAEDAELSEVQQTLDQAQPGEFLTIDVVLEDELATFQLRVQPHLFGAWIVLDLPEGPGSPPIQAVRGRQVDFRQVKEQAGQLGEVLGALQRALKPPEQ